MNDNNNPYSFDSYKIISGSETEKKKAELQNDVIEKLNEVAPSKGNYANYNEEKTPVAGNTANSNAVPENLNLSNTSIAGSEAGLVPPPPPTAPKQPGQVPPPPPPNIMGGRISVHPQYKPEVNLNIPMQNQERRGGKMMEIAFWVIWAAVALFDTLLMTACGGPVSFAISATVMAAMIIFRKKLEKAVWMFAVSWIGTVFVLFVIFGAASLGDGTKKTPQNSVKVNVSNNRQVSKGTSPKSSKDVKINEEAVRTDGKDTSGDGTVMEDNEKHGKLMPSAFIPAMKKKYSYEYSVQNGTAIQMDEYCSKISDNTLGTSVNVVPNSEAYASHYFQKNNDFYIAGDREPEKEILWLPADLSQGKQWKSDNFNIKLLETGASLDLGFIKAGNCIVLQEDLEDGSMSYVMYLAPGMGTVMIKDPKSGKTIMILKGVSELSLDEEALVKKYSPNIGKVKSLQ